MAEDGSDNVVNISIKLTAPTNIDDEEYSSINPNLVGYKVRLVSEWLDCCGATGIFGKGDLGWSSPPEEETKEEETAENVEREASENDQENQVKSFNRHATFEKAFPIPNFLLTRGEGDDSDENDRKEKLSNFNLNPGIYAILCKDERKTEEVPSEEGEEPKEIVVTRPLGFSYLDSSSFLMSPGVIAASNFKIDGYEMEVSISLKDRMLSYPEIVEYEPLVLDLKRLNYYPILEDEIPSESTKGVYIFGELPLGKGVQRSVLAILPSTGESENVDIGLQLCMLPGLVADLKQFKDLLTSSTFTLEIHQGEDVFTRAFHPRNVEDYRQQIVDEKLKEAEDAAAATPAKGKGKAPAKGKGAEPEGDEYASTGFGAIKESDRFLATAIHKSLKASRQLRAHGTIRFRLQNLLSSSNDLLTKFKRTRYGQENGDEEIVVEEEMNLEVRLEVPSKPEKWDLPADISLKSALRRKKEEERSRLDGTLAGTTAAAGKKSGPPRHELFFTSGTHVEVDAFLYRKLLLSQEQLYTTAKLPPLSAATPLEDGEMLAMGSDGHPGASSGDEGEEEYKEGFGDSLSEWELKEKLAVTPFTRMIILMKYMDDETLSAVGESLNKINTRALPNIQGSIRSYSLSPEELQQSQDGKLDLISGFMIIDDDLRLLVLEGLAGSGQGMQHIFADLPRAKANDDQLKIVCNPEVLFPDRIYAEFSPDIRRIRVRDKLKKLARKPEVYNRKQVEEICFDAIDGIMNLKRSMDMETAKKLDMFPSSEALNELELLYGETISRTDMDGTAKKQYLENADKANEGNIKLREKHIADRVREEEEQANMKERKRAAFVGTDCRNPNFDQYLATRPLHRVDHMEDHRTVRMQVWEDMLHKRSALTAAYGKTLKNVLGASLFDENKKEPKVHMYSNQSLNYKTKAFNKVRDTIAEDKDATYTFSKDFVSQTICTVDLKLEAKKEAATEWSKNLTKGGFQYPKRKTPQERNTHDKRPTDARIEELSYAFKDRTDVVRPIISPKKRAQEEGYKTMIKPDGVGLFGALNPNEYSRDFELKLVGDRDRLPRGQLTAGYKGDKDDDCFRSVHVKGVKAQKIMEEAQAKEVAEWKSKVVVDHIDFKMSGFKVRDKPILCDRGNDILQGEPKQKALKQLRELKSLGGKDYGYKTTPLSMLADEPFADNAVGDRALARVTDKSKFITTREIAARTLMESQSTEATDTIEPGIGEDFRLYIKSDQNKSIDAVLSKTPAGYDPTGKRLAYPKAGPKWDPAAG